MRHTVFCIMPKPIQKQIDKVVHLVLRCALPSLFYLLFFLRVNGVIDNCCCILAYSICVLVWFRYNNNIWNKQKRLTRKMCYVNLNNILVNLFIGFKHSCEYFLSAFNMIGGMNVWILKHPNVYETMNTCLLTTRQRWSTTY